MSQARSNLLPMHHLPKRASALGACADSGEASHDDGGQHGHSNHSQGIREDAQDPAHTTSALTLPMIFVTAIRTVRRPSRRVRNSSAPTL